MEMAWLGHFTLVGVRRGVTAPRALGEHEPKNFIVNPQKTMGTPEDTSATAPDYYAYARGSLPPRFILGPGQTMNLVQVQRVSTAASRLHIGVSALLASGAVFVSSVTTACFPSPCSKVPSK